MPLPGSQISNQIRSNIFDRSHRIMDSYGSNTVKFDGLCLASACARVLELTQDRESVSVDEIRGALMRGLEMELGGARNDKPSVFYRLRVR